jgi:transposase
LDISEKISTFEDTTYNRKSRKQLQISSLEDKIVLDNPIRFMDAFVVALSLEALGFLFQTIKTEDCPNFDTKIFLELFLYGYLIGLRSFRKLEKV